MRTRWKAGIFAASSLALVTAVSLAQRPERPRPTMAMTTTEAPVDRKAWRSKAEPQDVLSPSPSADFATIEQPGAAADPMDAVESFLRRNRKEADDSIQALSREAEALRARLTRVDAALARWQAVAGSLNPGQKWAQPGGLTEPSPELAPILPPETPSGAKTPDVSPSPSPFDPPATPSVAPVVPAPVSEIVPIPPAPPSSPPPTIPPPGPEAIPEPR